MTTELDIWALTRRTLLKCGALVGTIFATQFALHRTASAMVPAVKGEPSSQNVDLNITINGQMKHVTVDTRLSLLDLLRNNLRLSGTKKGCDHGQCGACTVILNGHRINSCLTLAVMHEGDSITTIEGLGSPDNLHPMQAAFVEHDGFQCGYCTPGQICSAIAMIGEARAGMPSHVTQDLKSEKIALSDEEIRERMSGNICRCAAYPNIVEAIKDAESSI